VVAQMWRGSRRSLPNQSRQPSAYRRWMNIGIEYDYEGYMLTTEWDGLISDIFSTISLW